MKRHFYILMFLLETLFVQLYGQNIMFRHLDATQGLSSNAVTSIYQDFRGFLWMGTRNGLNLYNGNEFTSYKYDKDHPEGLPSNFISQITGDGFDNLYIQTEKGISIYSISKASFSTLTKEGSRALFFKDVLYFASNNTIYRYAKEEIKEICSFPHALITRIYVQNDSILIGTENKGLYLYRQATKKMSHLIERGKIYDIFHDSKDNYWITDYAGGGLFRIDQGKIEHFSASSQAGNISHNQTHRCCEDQNGDIWIGTFNGLNKYDYKTGRFTAYYKEENANSLNESSIWSLYCDRQGTVWAGTYYGGVNYFNPTKQVYQKFEYSRDASQGLIVPVVSEMVEDANHNLWMCTEGGGVCQYNLLTGKFSHYVHSRGKNSLSHNHVKALYYDAVDNVLWIGTHLGGLNKLEIQTGRVTCYQHDRKSPNSIPSDVIMDITAYHDELILSTYNGVVSFNPKTGECHSLPFNEGIRIRTQYSKTLLIDHLDNLWIVPLGEGVLCYNLQTGRTSDCLTPSLLKQLGNKKINSLYQDSLKRLWICTAENGLGVYTYDIGTYEEFDTRNGGLASNVIYAVRELADGKYILTTDVGFSLLDYQKREAVNYRIGKEIPLNAISENSLHVTKNGRLFIGGMDGVVSFTEKTITSPLCSFNIYINKLYINGNEVTAGDKYRAFAGELTATNCIKLHPECETFTLQYAVTDYLPYEKKELEYRLEGFMEQWQRTRGNLITYSRLTPGTYTLQIRAKNSDNETAPLCSVEIQVLPPFYQTWVAYFFYVIFIVGIVGMLILWYKRKVALQTALVYEQKHAKEIEALTQSKLRFFIDISHEFRTPLTIILGQIEVLLQQQVMGTHMHNSLLKVYKNCMHLKELITELLDFRKHEQGHMTIRARQQDIVAFLQNHFQTFQPVAMRKKISYKFIRREEKIELWFDERLLWKVMNNLVSNAFKHTWEKGEIKVTVYQEGDEVVIEVTDNGEGIAPEDIEKVFERFYRIDRKSSRGDVGTGVGLSLTKGIVDLHHGTIKAYSKQGIETVFTVRLKTGKQHFSEEEIGAEVEGTDVYTGETLSENISDIIREDEVGVPVDLQNEGASSVRQFAKMIVAEDNDELRELLVTLFAPYYHVLEAKNGKEALEMAGCERPDIVVSDIMMPELSGMELCRKLKQEVATCHIPVVLLTAKSDETLLVEGLKVGADDYVEKPFNPRLLLLRCNNLTNSRRRLIKKFSEHDTQIAPMELACDLQEKAFMDRVTQLIHERMENAEFNVDMLVREIGISRTKFFARLKAISGQTPSEFIQDIRLKEAARLLKDNPFLNVTGVSEKVGFNSPQYFRKCFKEKYHVTPLEYRGGEKQTGMS